MKIEEFKCYLPIEIKARELDSRLYLAMSLAQKGFKVVIGKKSGVNRHMFSQNKNFIYFDKGISPGERSFYKAIKAANGIIVGIREEGIFNNFDINVKEFIDTYDNSCAELFSLFFIWGDRSKEIMEKHCPKIDKDKLIVTGHPSLDLLKENLIGYYYKLRELNYKVLPGYILINTNFSRINGYLNFDRIKIFNYKNEKLFNTKFKKEFDVGRKYEEIVFVEFSNMIESLAKSFPEKNIVIRPHPVENLKIYQDKFEEFKNVQVIREGSSKEWIVGAEAIIHHDCTTGVESFFAKKHVISFSPFENESLTANLPQEVSMKFSNINELIDYIKNGYTLKSVDPIKKREEMILVLKKIIDNVDSNATIKISKCLENLCSKIGSNNSNIFNQNFYFAKYKLENLIFKIKMKLIGKNIKDQEMQVNQRSKFEYLKKKEVIDRLNILSNLLNINETYMVDELEMDTFLIRK